MEKELLVGSNGYYFINGISVNQEQFENERLK